MFRGTVPASHRNLSNRSYPSFGRDPFVSNGDKRLADRAVIVWWMVECEYALIGNLASHARERKTVNEVAGSLGFTHMVGLLLVLLL